MFPEIGLFIQMVNSHVILPDVTKDPLWDSWHFVTQTAAHECLFSPQPHPQNVLSNFSIVASLLEKDSILMLFESHCSVMNKTEVFSLTSAMCNSSFI